MAIRAALWAAVSSKPQAEKVSNEEQLAMGRQHAAKLGATIVAELVVPGESRNIALFEDAARRIAAYAELKRLIDASAFDVLIYLDRSRLGRQASLSMSVVALCTQAGIATYDMESPPATLTIGGSTDEMLMGAIKSVTAQTEIERMKYRHRMGMIGRVRKGLPANSLAYGYKFAYRQVGDKIEKYVVLDEGEAVVVRRILDWYLDGHGSVYIADALNRDGIPSPGGAQWRRHTVIVLLNRAHWYAGYSMLNLRSKTGRPIIQAPAQWPAIIDAATYQQLQDERRVRTTNRRVAETKHVLAGVCVCMTCGANMTMLYVKQSDITYAVCRRHGYVAVRADVVLSFIREQLALLRTTDIDALLDTGDNDATTKLTERIEAQRQIIMRGQQSMRRIDDAYTDGTMDTDRYRNQVDRIKTQLLQAAAEIERLQALAAAEAEAGTRRQRLEYARDHAVEILDAPAMEANVHLRRLFRVWCGHKQVSEIDWL